MTKKQLFMKVAETILMIILYYLVFNYHLGKHVQILLGLVMIAIIWLPDSLVKRKGE